MTESSAQVILFPIRTRNNGRNNELSCYSCLHAYIGVGGVLCEVVRDLVDEGSANDCGEYVDE